MDARLARAALFVAAILSLGAGRPQYSVRSAHFVVSAPTPQYAQEVCQEAERLRRDLAIEWLGRELPEWRDICPITVNLHPNAGGATSFVFQGNFPTQWTMQIQGTRERILDSVLPHEITHTIFATHFGGPLPRWADEGACTTVEHDSEKAKQDKLLIRFLRDENRGIPFNRMFAMRNYPPDILPLYSQGYSLARFLIHQGGKRKFVQYVGDGMRTNNWTAATSKFYGMSSLSDLQVTWLDWVRQGSPDISDAGALAAAGAPAPTGSIQMAGTQMASLTQQPQSRIPGGALASWQTTQAQNARAFAQADQPPLPQATNFAAEVAGTQPPASETSTVSRPVSDGWYARRRDQAQAVLRSSSPPAADLEAPPSAAPPAVTPAPAEGERIPAPPTRTAVPAAGAAARRVLFEWTRPADEPLVTQRDLSGVVRADTGTVLR